MESYSNQRSVKQIKIYLLFEILQKERSTTMQLPILGTGQKLPIFSHRLKKSDVSVRWPKYAQLQQQI